ncbi:hypothetical protein P3T22_003920 [Paraburkholderia sp. GAS348]
MRIGAVCTSDRIPDVHHHLSRSTFRIRPDIVRTTIASPYRAVRPRRSGNSLSFRRRPVPLYRHGTHEISHINRQLTILTRTGSRHRKGHRTPCGKHPALCNPTRLALRVGRDGSPETRRLTALHHVHDRRFWIPSCDSAGSPRGRVRLYTMRPKLLCKILTPPLKIVVTWIQPTPVRSPHLHTQMHMRMGLIVVRCKDIRASVAKLERRKITRRIAHGLPVRSRRHRQKDIEYFAVSAGVRYPPSAELPGFHEVAQRIYAGKSVAGLIFQFDLAVTRDVTKMPTYGSYSLGTRRLVGDLDHHLRRTLQRSGELAAHARGFVPDGRS